MLQQSITQRALAMVNMCHDAEISIALNGNGRNSCFKLGWRWFCRRSEYAAEYGLLLEEGGPCWL